MREALISAQSRAGIGTGSCRKLRAQGRIPAVIYGYGKPARPISLSELEFNRFLAHNSPNAIIRFKSEDKEIADTIAIVKDIQKNPMRGSVVHVDFQEISLSDKVSVAVPVTVTGRQADDRGILEQLINEVTVEAVATKLPAQLVVDVTGLAIGDSKRIADIELPEDVEVLDDPEAVVVRVSAPQIAPESIEGEEGEEGAEDAETAETASTDGAE